MPDRGQARIAVRAAGPEPVAHGEGMAERVRASAPGGADLALDVAAPSAEVDLSNIDMVG
ncbi:hypothetical protein GCM10010252_69390 [Streptomyces aureoverticillatus]|nr:hypothetical protein GCM10010252_69390 [Streptomyces aureoverticillatus]